MQTTAYREFEDEAWRSRPHLVRQCPELWERLQIEKPHLAKRFEDLAATINRVYA